MKFSKEQLKRLGIDPKAVKAAISAAVECCTASVATLKTAHRFLSTA